MSRTAGRASGADSHDASDWESGGRRGVIKDIVQCDALGSIQRLPNASPARATSRPERPATRRRGWVVGTAEARRHIVQSCRETPETLGDVQAGSGRAVVVMFVIRLAGSPMSALRSCCQPRVVEAGRPGQLRRMYAVWDVSEDDQLVEPPMLGQFDGS